MKKNKYIVFLSFCFLFSTSFFLIAIIGFFLKEILDVSSSLENFKFGYSQIITALKVSVIGMIVGIISWFEIMKKN